MDFASSFGFSLIAAPQDSNLSSRSRSRDSADFFNETPLLWFANINHESLEENSSQWRMILNKLSEEEKKKVNRFIFHADRKRALLSILLQRAAVHETFNYRDFDDYKIHRTREVTHSPASKSIVQCLLDSHICLEQAFPVFSIEVTWSLELQCVSSWRLCWHCDSSPCIGM